MEKAEVWMTKEQLAVNAAFMELKRQKMVPDHPCDEIRFWYALERAIEEYDKARQKAGL